MVDIKETKHIENLDILEETLIKNIENAKKIKEQIESIKEMKKIDENQENLDIAHEELLFDTDDDLNKNDEYLYYYDAIKNCDKEISLEDLKKIIKNNLPTKDNSNYFNIISYMKAEIGREIKETYSLYDKDTSDEFFIAEINEYLNFYRQKLSLIDTIENEKMLTSQPAKENKIIFLKTSFGNVYGKDDLENISSEYYESFNEIYESIKNGTFKNVKRFVSNNKIKGLSQVKSWNTRLIFDRVSEDTYIIINLFIKKSNNETIYAFDTLARRNSLYQLEKQNIISKLNDEEFINENKQYQEEFESILSKCKTR